jgi:hypothetical protein
VRVCDCIIEAQSKTAARPANASEPAAAGWDAPPPEEDPATGLARFVVVTVSSPHHAALLAATRPAMEPYARAVGADCLRLGLALPPALAAAVAADFSRRRVAPHLLQLLALRRLLERGYERVLWLDAAALVLSGCADLFALPLAAGADVAGFDEGARPGGSAAARRDRGYLRDARNLSLPAGAP